MAFENLPGVFSEKIDGGLDIFQPEVAPNTIVLGTAAKGAADQLIRVIRTAEIVAQFGLSGTLARGMYEVKDGGTRNVRVYRMGATSAVLEGVGNTAFATSGDPGYIIETSDRDDTAGSLYAVHFDDTKNGTAGLLKIWRNSDDYLVYSNESGSEIDTLDVIVSGSVLGGTLGGPIGTDSAAGAIDLESVNAISGLTNLIFTAGVDGSDPSRMELYTYLYEAYKALENERVDKVVPMDAYVDDINVVDLSAGEITTLDLASMSAYPTANTEQDILGKLYVEEYLGETYFFWDTDDDGEANIFPSVGSATATTNIAGDDITDSFIEINFGYQLANFCYNMSVNNNECIGTIGMRPPLSFSPKDLANWVGSLPTYTVSDAGVSTIVASSDDGTGLLGNKFMAGAAGYRGGDAEGGFIATDSGNLGGTEIYDQNNELIDIGKYLSIVPSYVRLANQWTTNVNGYITNGAPSYAGFVMSLDSKSAPTNKVLPRVRAIHGLNNSVLDALAGVKYVMLSLKPKGTVVSDAPTAARQSSDYRRLSTVRIVKDSIDVVRAVADPFVGEANTAQRRAALETAVDAGLGRLQREGYLQGYSLSVSSTPQQQIQGDATIELTLVPAFELRQITIVLSLSALT